MADTWNVRMAQGEDLILYYDEVAPDGSIVSLAGRAYEGTIRLGPHSTGEPLDTYTCEIVAHPVTEDEDSAVKITLTDTESAALPPLELSHDLWCTHTDGTRELCLFGVLKLFKTPTHVEEEA